MKVEVVESYVYVASDGKRFSDKRKCEEHEMNLRNQTILRRKKVTGLATHLREFCELHRTNKDTSSLRTCNSTECAFAVNGECKFEQPPHTWTFVDEI